MKKSIAKDLLSISAVFLRPEQPFTWASGIKSPIYCDNRLTLTAPRVRDNVEKGLDRMAEADVENHSLSNLDALVEAAAEEGYIKQEDCARIIAFRNNPSDESWINK